ncbi:hypothetical protein GCM10010172_80180 [Paractinoplanes ferrugineus]|uniref:Uncharacterized protein n=1 Tax=Paractinoplanes ferrugineus TaxID=113564 RepID=A0A919JCD3_9ACTN|nr:hypothetical protein [Actinoplanes ferrugineus]GIE16734.1 hypothetical protein Afe05nite_85740 [Actinoplanes ferrugineus]
MTDPNWARFDAGPETPAKTVPTRQTVASIWTELQRLNIPMRGWWYEPEPTDDCPELCYGMEVAKEALTDWEVDCVTFNWDEVNGWTMDSYCAPGMTDAKPVVMAVDDPYDPVGVAGYFKAVIDGEINEFRAAT